MINLRQLQYEVGTWSKNNFPNNTPTLVLLGVGEELGELHHAHLKTEQGIRGFDDKEKSKAAKEDAIGDIVIYLADYCERSGLSLEESVNNAWNEVKRREWNKKQN